MRPVTVTKTLAASSVNKICLSQTPGSATDMTLNGAAVSGGVATLDTQRQVLLTPAGATGCTFTVYGTNDNGDAISEAVASPTGATATTLSFKTVTRIATSAASSSALTVGTNGVGATMPIVVDQYTNSADMSLFVAVTGTINYTVQFTGDNVFDPAWVAAAQPNWQDHSALASKTANANSNIAYPPSAVRLVINSFTGTASATLVVRESGIGGV